uniref:Uncharacterized protein n=1 Tax=Panagrolaimus davidi TaxID=227884 RepID=A0A914PEK5_9BILA
MLQSESNELVDLQGKDTFCGYYVTHLGRQPFIDGMPYKDPDFNIVLKKLKIDNHLKKYQAEIQILTHR